MVVGEALYETLLVRPTLCTMRRGQIGLVGQTGGRKAGNTTAAHDRTFCGAVHKVFAKVPQQILQEDLY